MLHLIGISLISIIKLNRYRFDSGSILYLTRLIEDDTKRPTNRNKSMSQLEMVCLTLRYLASKEKVEKYLNN